MFVVHPVNHMDRIGRGPEGVAGRAAHRLDEHRRADAAGRPAGESKVLGSHVVLGRRGQIVGTIAVERVEGASAQRLGNTDGDIHAVPERRRRGRIGQNSPVACRHITGGEVEPCQLDTGVLDGTGKSGHLGVRRRG